MKKQTPSTFVLNVADEKYFLVTGKISPFYGPSYDVYFDASDKPAFYTAKNFVEEHGVYSKIPVSKFVNRASNSLTFLRGMNQTIDETCIVLNDIDHKLRNSTEKKVLKKEKKNLLNAIEVYNDVKHLLPGEIKVSYEEDYELVTKEPEVTTKVIKNVTHKNVERRVVKQIENRHENVKGIQRTLKYE